MGKIAFSHLKCIKMAKYGNTIPALRIGIMGERGVQPRMTCTWVKSAGKVASTVVVGHHPFVSPVAL